MNIPFQFYKNSSLLSTFIKLHLIFYTANNLMLCLIWQYFRKVAILLFANCHLLSMSELSNESLKWNVLCWEYSLESFIIHCKFKRRKKRRRRKSSYCMTYEFANITFWSNLRDFVAKHNLKLFYRNFIIIQGELHSLWKANVWPKYRTFSSIIPYLGMVFFKFFKF